jgi:meso-butanediol dehydrogenase / (S,S)-butanediol dehydrogenase / diacetyl reductase
MVKAVLERYGRLDAIHNNAGISSPSKPLHETDEEQWDTIFDINLKSVYLTTYYAFEALKASRGCILNTASMVGMLGQDNHAAYVATKGGMIALTKAMALDYAGIGIRVNAICPAAVWTPLLDQWVQEQPDPPAAMDFLNNIHALGYCPEGDVIADAAVFLLSDKARFITGVALPVSGGAELVTATACQAVVRFKKEPILSSTVIRRVTTYDARFQLNPGEGADAIHTDPQYAYAVAILCTDHGCAGTGLAFTLGEGTALVCSAIQALGNR